MSSLDETTMCGLSREHIRKFLKMPPEERDGMTDEEKTEVALAFHHVEGCGYYTRVENKNIPGLCNELWHELRTITWERDENGSRNAKYDLDVAKYLLFAKFPSHNAEGTDDNPLKNLKW